jgi:peptide/nickel transport system ATP-binding protein
MAGNILSIVNLAAYYQTPTEPVKAVDGVSFDVAENEIFGIAGESACGKSTLALTMIKLLKPPAYIVGGQVLFKGTDIINMPVRDLRKIRWKEISYIPQSSMNALNPVAKVKNQIGDAIKNHEKKISKTELQKRTAELLISVGLDPYVARMYPHELSGGMKQRVIIAMATALSPVLIIADEPTTALDVVTQRGIIQLLRDIKQKLKASIIIITHDMAAQAEVADRVGIMYAGKIVAISDVNALFKEPLHPYAQALISAIPSIKEEKIIRGASGLPPDLRNPPPGCRFQPRCPCSIPNKCNIIEPKLAEVKKDQFVACHLYG